MRGLSFDTTSSNTGIQKGAAIRIQKLLQRKVLFLACRHHSAELIAKNVWYKLFPADKSPECKLFVDLRGAWDYLDKAKETQI